MPLLNYTTTVTVEKTVAEIQEILRRAGVDAVSISYAAGVPVGLAFAIGAAQYRLPCRSAAVLALLKKDRGVQPRYKTDAQAQRIAWRILRSWIDAQLAIIQTGMVTTDEVFMPYMLGNDGQTIYEAYGDYRQLSAKAGKP